VIDHVAINVSDYEGSKAFYRAAAAPAGCHPTDYAAFVHDPDGNNLEVVNHNPGVGPA
jgi:catechol 2,3-dioxygenase-like lactoylglutathione lyase family enzyme